jgi:hypothetical protein
MKFYQCDRSGGDAVPAIDYGDEDDFDMPPGWGDVTIRVREPNPEILAIQEGVIETQARIKDLVTAAKAAGETEPSEEFLQAEEDLRGLLEELNNVVPTVVVERAFHLAPPSLAKVLRLIVGEKKP